MPFSHANSVSVLGLVNLGKASNVVQENCICTTLLALLKKYSIPTHCLDERVNKLETGNWNCL